jgi:DNA-binding GntR family transcriptional regulator
MATDGDVEAPRHGENVAAVEERIRQGILRGEIEPGSIWSQVALGESLGVGRTPIREALRLLQRDGLVLNAPRRRVMIAPLSARDAEELYISRIALETVAIRLTVPQMTTREVAELEGHRAQMDRYVQERDPVGIDIPHRNFHLALVAGGGERIVGEVGLLFDHGQRYRFAYGTTEKDHWTLRSEEHNQLLEAAAERDGDKAGRLLAEHYAHTARLVFEALDPGYDLTRLRRTLQMTIPGSEKALRIN